MQTYAYKGFDATGRPRRGLVEALSLKQAREKLAGEGVLAEHVAPSSQGGGRGGARFDVARRTMVYRGLGTMLDAGVPLARALELLQEAPELRPARLLLAAVRDRVREGQPLGAAFQDSSAVVSALERSVMLAAEAAGSVGPMLEGLALHLEQRERVRQRVQNALIYPSIVFCAGLCIAILMLGLLVPRTQEILGGGRAALPLLTRAMMALGRGLSTWGAALLAVGVPALLLAARTVRRDEAWGLRWDRGLFRLPVLGRGYTLLVNQRFASTLAMLVRAGLDVIEAMVLAGRSTGSPWVASLAETQAEEVRHGMRLSDVLRRIPPLRATLPGWVEIGEASGGLPGLLEKAAARYEELSGAYIARCLSLVEPVLIIVIGGFVLLVALSVLLPVISLSRTLGMPAGF